MTCPVASAAVRAPGDVALVFGEERIRYDALEARIQRAVAELSARGVAPGDRVAVTARSHPDVLVLFFALPRLGATLVPLSTRWTEREVARALGQARPRWWLDERSGGLEERGGAQGDTRGDAPAALLFTSGTSGVPKLAPLSALQLDAASRASSLRLGGGEGNRWLGTLPLFHVGGLVMAYRSAWAAGRLVLEPRFDAGRVWELLVSHGISHASLVAATLRRVLDAANGRTAPRSLRAVLVGGGPAPRQLWARARAMGFPAVLTYGLTEAASQVCTEAPEASDGWSAGPPLWGVQVRVVDGEGRPLEAGEPGAAAAIGEIEVRGPTVMHGYVDAPEAMRSSLPDGWLRTGNLGQLDPEGRLRIVSRRTDLIVSGGENVYPAEVEAVLLEHPAVADAAVVGSASEEWGQVPVAFVVWRESEGPAGLEQWCRERLGSFKVPRRFMSLPELPRNAAGKIDRGALWIGTKGTNVRAERYVEQVSQGDVTRYLGEVERSLTAALEDTPGQLAHGSETLGAAGRHLTLGTGGKRVRPLLAYMFGRVCDVPEAAVVTVGVSAELVHTASLLHDDVVDQGMFRRSRPTVNALWGNNVAVMGGDMLLTLAIQQLEQLDRRVTSEAIRTVAEMTRATIAEVEGRGDLTLAVDRFRAICEGKTGALFAYCGSAVGHLADDPEAVKRLSTFARHLGVAFQFADDVLDLTGRDVGKPQFADLRSRTPALPLLLAVNRSDAIRRQIRDLWGFGSMPDARVREVGTAILAEGVAEEAAERVRIEIAAAEDALGVYARRPGGDELVAWGRELARSVAVGETA